MVYVLAKVNQRDGARQEFQKSLDENADDFTVTVHARFELISDALQGNYNEAFKLSALISTIYNNHICSESLLKAAKIFQHFGRKQEALKMYSEIINKYKNSLAASYAEKRIPDLK